MSLITRYYTAPQRRGLPVNYRIYDKADNKTKIEQPHSTIIQVCNIERFQVRSKVAILNHIFASLRGFIHLQQMQIAALISSTHQYKREPCIEVISAFIRSVIPNKQHLTGQFRGGVNA